MPTVEVSWMGKFPDRAKQQELCACLMLIAETSHQLYNDFFGIHVEPHFYDGSQQYSVALLSESVFGKLPQPEGFELAGKQLFLVKDVGLYGLEFVLFDPRRFNSPLMMVHNYDVSFAFLRSDNPDLDGLMVEVIHISDNNPLKSTADILLRVPELDLRYYLEHWMNDLLGWVKRFYLHDLFYWASSDNPCASEYEKFDPGDRKARDEILLYLREAFVAEAENWKSACIAHRKKIDADVTSTEWLEREDELFNQLAQQEKRRRNHGT